ncbi:hypothetical protein ACWCP6_08935 [Streptomyces sp. NPDC002004]
MPAPHEHDARAGLGLRLLRAAVFTAVCVVLSAAGHGLASCSTVPLWAVGAGFLAVFAVVAPLAGRTRSLPGIAVVLAVGQVTLHTLFGLGQHGTTMVQSADASLVERAARLVCGASAAPLTPAHAQRILADAGLGGPGGMAHMTGPMHAGEMGTGTGMGVAVPLLPSVPMLLGHVLAGVVAGWLLRRGDLALLRLIQLSAHHAEEVAGGALVRSLRGALRLVRALCAGLPGAPDAGPRTAHTPSDAAPKPRTSALQHTVIRRGPPAVADLSLAA